MIRRGVRPDARIAGIDPAMVADTGAAVIRFADTPLLGLAVAGPPLKLSYNWSIIAAKARTNATHSVWLPRPKLPIIGPNGVQAWRPSISADSSAP
jgi:hypothetical protein